MKFLSIFSQHAPHLIELAAFLGLNCTTEAAEGILGRHANPNPPSDYRTQNISTWTLRWMDETMATLLPEAMLSRYGVTPIYT